MRNAARPRVHHVERRRGDDFRRALLQARRRLVPRYSYPIWSNIVGFARFGFLLKKTVFGKNVLAVGGNSEAALLAGLPVTRIKIAVFVLQVS
jgi:ribose/xylose/arabinose/galactoside ABC-type transport system permease subunit